MGAGIFTANALLTIKINPREMVSSSSLRIFCEASVTVVQYAFLMTFNLSWFICLGVLGISAGLLSKFVLIKIIESYKID